MRLRGFASSARLVATFACAKASAVTKAITAGMLSCVLMTALLSQCKKSLQAGSAYTAGLHFSKHQFQPRGCGIADA